MKNPLPNFFDNNRYKKLIQNTKKEYLIKLIKKAYKYEGIFYVLNKKKLNSSQIKTLREHLINLNLHSATLTNKNSLFQYYYLGNLWKDIKMMIKYKIKILNASCNPLKASYLHKLFTGRYMKENQSKIYNAQMRSIHSEYWGKKKLIFV